MEGMEDNEEHDMVVNETFSSEEEGYKYYNAYAKSKGLQVMPRCGRGARMEIEMSMESGEWFVKGFVVEHNHPLAICNIPGNGVTKIEETDVCIAFMHRKSGEFSRFKVKQSQ
jgi:hypothetical protein